MPTSPPPNPTASQLESDYFDTLIASHGEFNPFADRGWATLGRRFTDMVAPAGPVDLLDVGCGTGQSLQIYERHCRRYVGIDLSVGAIEIARRKFPAREWTVTDACDLPFDDASFDVVAFSSVLHHIPDCRPALREAARVLRPGGKVFAYDPNLLHPAMALFRHPRSPLYSPKGVSPNERPLLPSELRHWFTESGLHNVRQRGQAGIPYRSVALEPINAFLGLYNVADRLMDHLGLDKIFGPFVLTVAVKQGPK